MRSNGKLSTSRRKQQVCRDGGYKTMNSSDTPVGREGYSRPLYVSIEMVSNLIYLARREEALDQQRDYLDRASSLLFEMRHHPDLPK
jgi:hypothetical protein